MPEPSGSTASSTQFPLWLLRRLLRHRTGGGADAATPLVMSGMRALPIRRMHVHRRLLVHDLQNARAPGADGPALTPGQPTADGDGGAEPPCGSVTVINRTISSRSAADGRPMPGWYP